MMTEDNETLPQQCLSYLMGEMSIEQARVFEDRLSDPLVANELERQSELICQVDAAIATSHSNASTSRSMTTASAWQTRVALFAAIAAGLLAVVSLRGLPTFEAILGDGAGDELLIAKTWVEQQSESALLVELRHDQPIEVDELDAFVDEPLADADELSWMVAAIRVEYQ